MSQASWLTRARVGGKPKGSKQRLTCACIGRYKGYFHLFVSQSRSAVPPTVLTFLWARDGNAVPRAGRAPSAFTSSLPLVYVRSVASGWLAGAFSLPSVRALP